MRSGLFYFLRIADIPVCYATQIIRFGVTLHKVKLSDIEHKEEKSIIAPRPIGIANPASTPGSTSTQRPMTSSSVLRRKLDKTSFLMLLYPLVNVTVILPLSVFRLLGLAGQHGSPQALAVCGCIFALGGLANTILYSFSRVSRPIATAFDFLSSVYFLY